MLADQPLGAALVWRKATRSTGGHACVEVASLPNGVAVRDSKDPDGPILRYTLPEWDAFIAGAKSGEFDYLLAQTAQCHDVGSDARPVAVPS